VRPASGAVGEKARLLLPIAILLVLLSHYPGWVARRSSLAQYFDGVYRTRVLARELILGIANAVDWLTGHTGPGSSPGFAVGWVVVTGAGFLLAWWLMRTYVRSRSATLGPIEVVIAGAMAVSATVLTPYDFVSYALIIATVMAARSGRTMVTAGLAAAAVATRESGLLAVAIIAASCVADGWAARDPGGAGRSRAWTSTWRAVARHRPLWAASVAAFGTYAALKITLRHGGGLTLFQHDGWRANFTTGSAWALAVAAGLVLAGRWATGAAGETVRRGRRVLWTLSVPYLVVLAIASSWGEAPRLVMPLVLGEVLLAVGSAPGAGVGLTGRSRVSRGSRTRRTNREWFRPARSSALRAEGFQWGPPVGPSPSIK
jgi:hypothetical protein